MEKARILIVEDDPDGSRSVANAIARMDCDPVAALTGMEGVEAFKQQACDVVLCDLMLPDISGIEVLTRILRIDPQVPVLMMTAFGTVSNAVEALKIGAYDYLPKPLDLNDLRSRVGRALETNRLRQRVARLESALKDRYSARAMVARSGAMQPILSQIESLASVDTTVLVLGETGTGKELVARALHVDGKRMEGPFVAVSCGAFTESLLDSELFGHEKGAFTGAMNQHRGAFERAHGGTLFLDEVGSAPPSVQVKLLRVLEEREMFRVGGQESIRVDVRVISASNIDLEELVEAGDFRQDLLYRLKVMTIQLPPLRGRRSDIRPLADHFLATTCHDMGRRITTVEPGYYEALEGHDWPGNVRELRNIVEVSVVMAKGAILRAEDVHFKEGAVAQDDRLVVPPDMSFAELEKEILLQTLRRCDGNRTLAAERLQLSRRTIQRRIQELGLPF
ncbi:MAG: sigma-54-dependent Fis family transcriptional regulator [Lentisphaerae bacterium]|nr:sigma-54-dependent Fis family transcriptional regulator [Lentisphaerota bacterium]